MRRALALGVAATLVLASTAAAHQGNPNYRSIIDAVTPAVRGLKLQVLNYDDRFELTNRTGQTITVQGYNGEPYARVLGNGTVEVNKRSPAYYLNDDRYADVKVPASADPKAPPQWTVTDRTGVLQWHDHRMHWMSQSLPPQVTDKSQRTKIFDYSIPLAVGGTPGSIKGTLVWQPEQSSAPVGMFVGLGILALIAIGGVALVRRRRAGGDEGETATPNAGAEAW
jgi:MYXO-CTERM domain-containing protein